MTREPEHLADAGTFAPASDGMSSDDPLGFPDYDRALEAARTRGADESVRAGAARIRGQDVELALFDFDFLGGSMGTVAGERLAQALERATARDVPFVLRTATGGARMQEGMASLVQMPKVVASRVGFARSNRPFIAVLGHPTTGGVLASIAALADFCAAEAGATIGFAGPRVAERAMGRPLGPGSHTAESALDNGLVDEVVTKEQAAEYVARILNVLRPDDPSPAESPPAAGERAGDAWGAVETARGDHPSGRDLIDGVCDEAVALRGDRAGADDPALAVALGRVGGRRSMLMALDPGHAPGPAAYRKARRAVQVAARLAVPIVAIVDTRGADPSESSEAGGVAWEIAATFEALLTVPVPVLAIVTGEGGSGGALAFATGDRLVAYEDSIFSVIGPELAAEILWRDAERASDAARLLRITAQDLHQLGIADTVIGEAVSVESVRRTIAYHLDDLPVAGASGAAARRQRWRNLR